MRISYSLLACLLSSQLAHADIVELPLHADGTVNLEKAMYDFEIAFSISENESQTTDFTGLLLGEPFTGGVVIEANTKQGFALTIEAPTLSEHGNFFIAVLATDAICARHALSPGLVLWSNARNQNGTIWEVPTSCVAATD